MADRLTLSLVTPTHRLLETECDEVRAPGSSGGLGIRPGHEPLLITLDAGPLQFFSEGKGDAFAVVGGFLEVTEDHVLVLADEAAHADTIDASDEETALESARKKLCEVHVDPALHRAESAKVRRHAARLATAKL